MSKETPAMPHIMVVEDDPVSRIARRLFREGYRVSASDNADDLLQASSRSASRSCCSTSACPARTGSRSPVVRAASRVGIILVTARDGRSTASSGSSSAPTTTSPAFNPRELLVRARNLLWRVAQCAGQRDARPSKAVFPLRRLDAEPAQAPAGLPGQPHRAPAPGQFKLPMAC